MEHLEELTVIARADGTVDICGCGAGGYAVPRALFEEEAGPLARAIDPASFAGESAPPSDPREKPKPSADLLLVGAVRHFPGWTLPEGDPRRELARALISEGFLDGSVETGLYPKGAK